MNISARRIPLSRCDYYEVTVTEGSTTIETGFLDCDESKALANQLRNAADDLSPLPDDPKHELLKRCKPWLENYKESLAFGGYAKDESEELTALLADIGKEATR